MSGPIRRSGADLFVDVRLTPRGGRDGLDGAGVLSDGKAVLLARVRAVPEDGRANAALVRLIAEAAGVPRSAVALVSGATARVKSLRIAGAGPDAEAALLAVAGQAKET